MPRYGSADDRRSWRQCAIAFREGFDSQLTAAVISTFGFSGRAEHCWITRGALSRPAASRC